MKPPVANAMGVVRILLLVGIANQPLADAARRGTNVTNIDVKNFFQWAVMPGDEFPSEEVMIAACAFLIRSVLKVTQDQGPKKFVSDAGIALRLCNQTSLRGQLVGRTQPRQILSLFLNVLTTSTMISFGNGLPIPTAGEIAAYVFDGGQPSKLLVVGPTAAGKSVGSPLLLSTVFAQDALLKETTLFIQLDNDNFKGLVKKVGENYWATLAVASFLERCRVTFGTGSRGKMKDDVIPLNLQQVYSPAVGYRSLLLLVMSSRQTVTCNAHMRAVIDGKTASPEEWDSSMNGIKTVLGHLSEFNAASPVWVWFNEVAAVCGHGDSCVNGDSGLGIAGFCTKYAHTLSEAKLMQRQFVSVAPLTMEPSDLLDILNGGEINYLHNLKHKSKTLQALKLVFPPITCTQSATACEIMNFQRKLVPPAPNPLAGGGSSAIVVIAIICVVCVASASVLYRRRVTRSIPPKDQIQRTQMVIPLSSQGGP